MSDQKFVLRVLVQGVGVFVPHTDRRSLLVLLPDQNRADQSGIRTFENGGICRHYAVAQFDARNRDPEAAEEWTSLDLTGHWVEISSDSSEPLAWAGLTMPGLPALEEVFPAAGIDRSFAEVDPRALPGPNFDPTLLKAGVLLREGAAKPAIDWEGPFDFHCGGPGGEREIGVGGRYANVIQFELGEVSRFALVLKPFGGGPAKRVALRPIGVEDELNVWIRHFCDIRKPDPELFRPKPSEADADFALTYALSNNLAGLLYRTGVDLPFPRVSKSWTGGIGVGGNPNKCMAAEACATDFQTEL